jgi:membrane dipeptidase
VNTFPKGFGYESGTPAFVNPRQLPDVNAALAELGYPDAAVRGILGANFLRVASQVWQ